MLKMTSTQERMKQEIHKVINVFSADSENQFTCFYDYNEILFHFYDHSCETSFFFAIFPAPHLLKQNPCTPYKNEKGTKFSGENVGPNILFICSTLRHWQSILSFTFWKWSEAEVTHQSIVIGKRNTTLVYWCYDFLQAKAVLILRNPHIWNVINIFFFLYRKKI